MSVTGILYFVASIFIRIAMIVYQLTMVLFDIIDAAARRDLHIGERR